MDRLSAIDAALVHGETPEWHVHVTSLLLLEKKSPAGYRFEAFRNALAHRLRGIPEFRQTVAQAPLGIDRPAWVDAGPFDAQRHIHRSVVGNPGSDRQLFDIAADVASRKLGHDRPLWECHVVETSGGRLKALIIKNHHALFDGVGGLESMQAMFDLSADAPAANGAQPPSPAPADPRPVPGLAEMLIKSVARGLVVQPRETVKVARQLVRQALPLGQMLLGGNRPALGVDSPASPFPGQITADRNVSGARLSLPLIKTIRRQADVKVNDVLLAVVGGALRTYLSTRASTGSRSLVANVAVSTRGADEKASGSNKFSVMFVTLGTTITDPADRLAAVHDSSVKAKRFSETLQTRTDTSIAAAGPPVMVTALARLVRAIGLHRHVSLLGHVGVSNVAGPPAQLFVGGAAVRGLFVFGPLMLNSMVNFTAVSNNDNLDVGVTSSPDAVPDIHDLASCLAPALDELAKALGCRP